MSTNTFNSSSIDRIELKRNWLKKKIDKNKSSKILNRRSLINNLKDNTNDISIINYHCNLTNNTIDTLNNRLKNRSKGSSNSNYSFNSIYSTKLTNESSYLNNFNRSINFLKNKFILYNTKTTSNTLTAFTKNFINSIFNHQQKQQQQKKSQCYPLSVNQFDLILIIQFFIFILIRHVHCQQVYPPNQFSNRNGAIRNWRIEEILPAGYNNQQPPTFNQSIAVQVDVTVKIRNIRFQPSKQDKSTSLFIDLDLILVWKDERLQIPSALQLIPNPKISLDYRWRNLIWNPMLIISNQKQIQFNQFFDPIVFIEINNRKQVYLNAKLSLELDCDFQLTKPFNSENQPETFGKNFGSFPFDTKECGIELISLSNSLDVISLRWSNFDLPIRQTNEFLLEKIRSEHCVTIESKQTYSCLRARFKLKRKFLSAFLNYQLPVMLFSFICYLTFFIKVTSTQTTNILNGHLIQIRVGLLIYSLTALYLQINHNENTPKLLVNHQDSAFNTNNSISLSIWHFVNLIFILIAIVEFVLQLNQSSVRIFLLKKIIKDNNQVNAQNYETRSSKIASNKIQLNTINNNLTTVNQDTISINNQSNNTDSKQMKTKNKIYLKMLGIKQDDQSTLNKHQSSSQTGQQETDWNLENDKDQSIDWLDNLFKIFYPLFYIAFVFLFTFIGLIS